MKGHGQWPSWPTDGEDLLLGRKPVFWYGNVDRDGTAEPWYSAPPGSIYMYVTGTTPKPYIKSSDTDKDDNDWFTIDMS